jgi:alpha-beta hydrolase superfamily lysophospholipase
MESIMQVGWKWFQSRRWLRCWLITFVFILLLWLIGSSAVAFRLTRRPRPRFEEPVPDVAWGRLEHHRIRTDDGHEIGAWFIDGRDDAPSVLLAHGNRGSRRNSLSQAEVLASRGCAVLMVSLRAHGDSTGEYHDVGFSARRDIGAGVQFLEKRRRGRAVLIIGTSMGAAAAVFAASELGHRVQGYILESPYRDLETAVWNRTEVSLPPVLSHVAYAGLRIVGPLFLPHLEQIAPIKAIAGIPADVPVLILAGDTDRLARLEEAQALYDRIAAHGRLVVFPGAGHGNLFRVAPVLYTRSVLEFCDEISKSTRISSSALAPGRSK